MGKLPAIKKFGTKLTIYSIVVALIPILILGMVSTDIITKTMNEQAQEKINTDLHTAEGFMADQIDKLSTVCQYSANSKDTITALKNNNISKLKEIAILTKKSGDADFATIFNSNGHVVVRSNSDITNDTELLPLVKKALDGKSISSIEILDENTVKKENIENKTKIDIIKTGVDYESISGHPIINKSVETRALALVSIKPIRDEDGNIIGAIMVSKILNKDNSFVDKIKEATKDTATIFLDGLRISTNVQDDNKRAIGTFVSKEVYDKVIKNGETYYGMAFVVNDWYLTAYKPIKNSNDEIIGMLYVGMPKKPFIVLQNSIKNLILGVGILGLLIALMVSFVINGKITKPLEELKKGAEMIGNGNYDFRVHVDTNDEFGELAKAFNKMADEIRKSNEKLKKQAEELEKSYNELKELDKLKSDIVAIVSHELRTPLTSIKGYVELVLDGTMGAITETQRKCLEIANENIDRLKRLIDNMLDLSKIERGELEMQMEKINLKELVEDVVDTLKPLADEKNIKIIYKINDMVLNGDKDRITQVLTNLIENAIKFSPINEKVEIQVLKEGNSIHMKVIDNGPGIPKRDLDRIFDRFYQVDSPAKRIKGGSGLGLAVCKSIIEAHGGTIWVESNLGNGSIFHIIIPIN
ncbi:cache domain-containing protein [Methanothermococcus sp. Ax23]|uniref:cache domain-containing protein n=1 Tax=Methanothermococcus sp. Ax23 TaxID=3156486 RepID=UPI003B9EEB44